jgi:hypothetical protein
VRVNIDVLNADQLFETRRDLFKSRYDVLVNSLRLRQVRPADAERPAGGEPAVGAAALSLPASRWAARLAAPPDRAVHARLLRWLAR